MSLVNSYSSKRQMFSEEGSQLLYCMDREDSGKFEVCVTLLNVQSISQHDIDS
jgi:hypothetical protein